MFLNSGDFEHHAKQRWAKLYDDTVAGPCNLQKLTAIPTRRIDKHMRQANSAGDFEKIKRIYLRKLEQFAIILFLPDAGWSSLAARRAHNPKVVGSNPAPATNLALPVSYRQSHHILDFT